jgi:uncharacterized protein (DUF342 family)
VLAGLWKAWFLPMFRGGEMLPAMPKVPPEVHIHQGEQVPYTDEEIIQRTADYDRRMVVWNKTMKVINMYHIESHIPHTHGTILAHYS